MNNAELMIRYIEEQNLAEARKVLEQVAPSGGALGRGGAGAGAAAPGRSGPADPTVRVVLLTAAGGYSTRRSGRRHRRLRVRGVPWPGTTWGRATVPYRFSVLI